MTSPHLPAAGPQHPRVREARQIAANAGAGRQRLFLAEGLWAHQVLLDLGVPVEVFLWCPESGYSTEARSVAARIAGQAPEAYRISERVLERLCERERPDGLVSLVPLPAWQPGDVRLGEEALVLVADAIEIPGNLGTLLRTADACGAACLILTNRRTRLAHPKVFRGSRGMNLRVPVLEFEDPAGAQDWLRAHGFSTFLATVSPAAAPYHEVRFGGRVALVVGNERAGICPGWLGLGLPEITIPMYGRADSLNVAVSASVLLYSARAQRPIRGL
ncbi:TrmH family RNA methyltransferase [Longispora albida]|uniref:TrmH family RNA methyltransferase n=1 Tax=Longispora albida TaxID=203523 RepID=UPI00037420EF|nr:TrmH family RNA methyltransferase [Longispora albida]